MASFPMIKIILNVRPVLFGTSIRQITLLGVRKLSENRERSLVSYSRSTWMILNKSFSYFR